MFRKFNKHKNHFHITFETASNLNKIKLSAFLLNSRHSTFQISPTLDKTPSLFAETFFYWKMFQKFFFDGMGVRALSDPRKRGRACPPFYRKKTFLKHFPIQKSFLQKVKEFYLKWGWFEIRNVLKSAKKQKVWFCSNWK